MKINREHQLLRIQLLGNGNFGAASGKVTIDRPTQVDAFNNLPFIPNSSLRGMLKAVSGLSASKLKAAFGISGVSDDEDIVDNRAGELVIGNGDLLTFPVLAENGARCWIFPLDQIFKFIAIEKLIEVTTEISALAGAFYPRDDITPTVLGIPRKPWLNLPFSLKQIAVEQFKEEINRLYNLLRRWCGNWISPEDLLAVVDIHTARFLWNRGAEIRTHTALDSKTKVARGQSLRKIETVPEGSIFLSFLSYLGSNELSFEDRPIQFGSAEGSGLGFCRLQIIETTAPSMTLPTITLETENIQAALDADLMTAMHSAIAQLKDNGNEDLGKKVRAAIGNLGWRLTREGWEAALAFELAKAKPAKPQPASSREKVEMRAHRWLLATLFGIREEEILSQCQNWFSGNLSQAQKQLIMQRWQWLRKYSEYELEI